MSELQKRTLLLMGKGTLIPPKTPVEMRDRIKQLLGDFLDITEEAKKEFYNALTKLGSEPFEVTINKLIDCVEKWFGE